MSFILDEYYVCVNVRWTVVRANKTMKWSGSAKVGAGFWSTISEVEETLILVSSPSFVIPKRWCWTGFERRILVAIWIQYILLARLPLWIVSFPVLMLKENSWKLIQNHFAQKQVLGQLWMKIWENLWWNEFLVRWVSLKSRDNEEWTWWCDGLEDKRKYMFITKKRFSALFHSLVFSPKKAMIFFDQ